MSVQSSCEHCGCSYVVKADMAGKKVRCRSCGQVFVINLANAGEDATLGGAPVPTPAQGTTDESELSLPSLEDLSSLAAPANPYERNSDTTRVMPAVHTSQSNMTGGVGSAKSAMERTGDPGTFDLTGGTAGSGVRPSKPFDFPFALELDKFGPKTIIGLLLLWAAYIAFTWKPGLEEKQQQHPGWSGLIPAAALLILFSIFWLPLFAVGMRRVAAAMKFAVPPRHKTRAAALAALPFALGSVFWLAGESVGTLVTGVILGIVIATPAAWFLYRLQEKEIPYAGIGLAVSGIVATILSIALYIGANLLLNQTLVASGQDKLFVVSPMGPNLAWPASERPQLASTPKPTTNRAAAPVTTPEQLPQQAMLRDVRGFSFDRAVEDVIFAPERTDVVGVVFKAADGTGQEMVRYSISAVGNGGTGKDFSWSKATPMDSTPAPYSPGDSCLSADATRMARLVRFQGSVAAVSLWSFDKNEQVASHRPPEWDSSDTIQLLGFEGSSNSRLICTRRQRGEFRPVTVDLDRLVADDWYDLKQAKLDDPTLQTNKMKDRHGDMVALSPDSTMVAITAVEMQGTRNFLRIYGNTGKVYDHNLGIKATKVALDPVGLAFSPDGSRVAVAYAEQGQVVIYTCPTVGNNPAVMAASINTGNTGPSSGEEKSGTGKARNNSLVWLAGGNQWLYGKMIADGRTQRFIGAIDLGQAIGQQTVFDGWQLMALVNNNGSALVQATIAVAAPAAPTTAEAAAATTRP